MRMKSLILIFIALGCGLVASIGISQVMDRGGGSGKIEMEQILVALTDIDIGSKLDDKNVKLEDWPKNKVPEGAVRRLEDVKNKFARGRFYKGEPLHISRLTDNPDTVSNDIPAGHRAVPVKVEEDTVMKAISPGDRVDVNVFLRKNAGNGIKETGVFTILKNVRVFAVNTNTERTGNETTTGKPQSSSFRTVSLLVKENQARDLNLATQVGKILLTLRGPSETDDETAEDMTPISDLLGSGAELASDPVAPGSNTLGGILDTLKGSTGGQAHPGGTPQKSLIIQTPNGFEQYDWFGPNQLPVKSTPVSLGPVAPPQPAQPGPASSPTPEPTTEDESEPTTSPDAPAADWLD